MDMLYQRYACPFLFMDGMIQTGRFTEFVENLTATVSKEKNDQRLWEYYLFRVWEGSFDAFKEGLETDAKISAMSANEIETTVQYTMNILQNFNPEKKG